MKQLLALIKIQFKGLLSATIASGKRKSTSLGLMLLFIIAILLYISGTFSLSMADALRQVGMLDLLLVLVGILAVFLPVIMSGYSVSGFLYKAKDLDLLFSLPIPPLKIVLSKLSAVYLENLLFVFFIYAPALGIYAFYAKESWSFYPLAVLILLLLPLFVTVIGLFMGYLLSLIQSRLKHPVIITNILYLSFFGLVMYGNFKLNSFISNFAMQTGDIRGAFNRYAKPVYWIRNSLVEADLLSFVLFALLCLIPFVFTAMWFAKSFRRINSDLQISRFKTVYTFRKMPAQSPFKALVKKEIRRYFGSPIYFMNTFVGVLMPLAGLIYLMISKTSVVLIYQVLSAYDLPLWAILTAAMMFSVGLANTTAPSISLETNKLWILKVAPLTVTQVFGAKIALNLLICVPSMVLAALISLYLFKLTLWQTGILVLLPILQCLLNAMFGIYANLLFPKLDATNDTAIVKQSASTILSMVFGMLSAAVLAFIGYQLRGKVDYPWLALIFALILLSAIAFMYRLLTGKGHTLYKALKA